METVGYLRRRIKREEVGGAIVSTVCLGEVHDEYGHTLPRWETLVFGNSKHDEYCERYETLEAALEGHARIVEMVRRGGPVPKRVFLDDHNSV